MFDSLTVLGVIVLYMGLLLVLAEWAERRSRKGRGVTDNAAVYSLAFAIYCTAWTFYGSAGTCATSGLLFLTFYLGPTMAMFLAWRVLRKLVRIKSAHRITNIADFISARYNRSQSVAALVTLIAILGITPYVSLQFKAIDSTFSLIIDPVSADAPWVGYLRGVGIVTLLVGFTIALGVRRVDPTERHPGLMMVLAVQCVLKLMAFVAVGVFVTYFIYSGFTDVFNQWSSQLASAGSSGWMSQPVPPSRWVAYLIMAAGAILLLPRQFHVQVVENVDERHVKTAMWLFPLYMVLITVFILPIAMGGLVRGMPVNKADTFVLALPLQEGWPILSLLVFMGGFTAALGMITVSAIAIATMITNHLILPLIGWFRPLGFLRRRLLFCRWAAVAAFISLGYWSQQLVAVPYMLGNIGVMSFVAVLQFGPALLGGIFWRRGNLAGARLGLSAGFLVWVYTLLVPACAKSGWISQTILDTGLFGLGLLRPEHLFGVMQLDHITHSVFWSMFFNVGLYVIGSLAFKQSIEEQRHVHEFVGASEQTYRRRANADREPRIPLEEKRTIIAGMLRQFFTRRRAEELTELCISAAGVGGGSRVSVTELAEIQTEIEKILTGALGAAEARRAVKDAGVFTYSENRELSEVYGEILAELKVTPEQLTRKVDYYRERERLLTNYASELEKQVELRTRALQAANEELEAFAYSVSHDLRAPLRSLDGFSLALLEDYEDKLDDEGRDFLNRLRSASQRMGQLIDALLKLSRVTRSAMSTEIVPLSEMASHIAAELREMDPSRNVHFRIAEGLTVKGDERLLRVAMENLLSNAWKFTARSLAAHIEFGVNGPSDRKPPPASVKESIL